MTINKNIMKIAAIGFVGILGLSGCNVYGQIFRDFHYGRRFFQVGW